MAEEGTSLLLVFLLLIVTGQAVVAGGSSLETDKEALAKLKSFLLRNNSVNPGPYSQWNDDDPSPCNWTGITCRGGRVIGVDLKRSSICGGLYDNFSSLTGLTHLDLSQNTISGPIPSDLNLCSNLKYLNLSHNIIKSELNLPGLDQLEALDLTQNRFTGSIDRNFPTICAKLVTLNISLNNFTGNVTSCFDGCTNLKYLDISTNHFTGNIWFSISALRQFTASENNLTGRVGADVFRAGCALESLDLSQNNLHGEFSGGIATCRNLSFVSLQHNDFSGRIPPAIGSLSSLEVLLLGGNRFDRDIPNELLGLKSLQFLHLSRNSYGGDVQPILGNFTQVKFMILHGNSFSGGLSSSGILTLPNLVRLDLSNNSFSGELPVELASMPSLKYLILANNQFSGRIPPEFGATKGLQALDLSYNNLTGPIPSSIGNLTSLLWLMLASNSLTGPIPAEIGNCRSLLWLNLANNRLSGDIPPSISAIGRNPYPTFESNRKEHWVTSGAGECLSMKRWIPASYPPFSFAYTIMNEQICRNTWQSLLEGIGIFPICVNPPGKHHTLAISGYIQLSGNVLSGPIPPEIGNMGNFSLIHLNRNNLSGGIPPEISKLPVVSLNVSYNLLSGRIPPEIGDIACLQNLDVSFNNLSGDIPRSLNRLTELDKFNASYNPLLSGVVPDTGQMATFERSSFRGDPLVTLASYNNRNKSSSLSPPQTTDGHRKTSTGKGAFSLFLVISLSLSVSAILFLFLLVGNKSKDLDDVAARTRTSSIRQKSRFFHVDKTMASFTYNDILTATANFAEETVIGRGGFGTVYRGILPDGRRVAIKKLLREGPEGEKEFQAEMMEAVKGITGSPHPNLVGLHGWCLFGSEKLLVYEFMEGGSLDDMITDWEKLGWERRLEVAVGVARALVFLHHECYPAVVHRDVKASNVLLDGEGRARLTDFGLARVVGVGESHVSTIVAGTVGYVAPEYGKTWQATTKGDVYSFGVLVMELATGRRAVDGGEEEGECLVDWGRRVGRRRGSGAAEEREMKVAESGVRVMWELVWIGLRCTAEKPQERPSMKEVLDMLVRVSPSDYNKDFA